MARTKRRWRPLVPASHRATVSQAGRLGADGLRHQRSGDAEAPRRLRGARSATRRMVHGRVKGDEMERHGVATRGEWLSLFLSFKKQRNKWAEN